MLRNQRDRFTLDYYDTYDRAHPHSQASNRLIWQTVIQHIARSNKRADYNQWQLAFYEEDLAEQRVASIPNLAYDVVTLILGGYHTRPLHPISLTPLYSTHNPATYDTLQRSSRYRTYPMTPLRDHQILATTSDNLSDMRARQAPVPPPRYNQGSASDLAYLQVRL